MSRPYRRIVEVMGVRVSEGQEDEGEGGGWGFPGCTVQGTRESPPPVGVT